MLFDFLKRKPENKTPDPGTKPPSPPVPEVKAPVPEVKVPTPQVQPPTPPAPPARPVPAQEPPKPQPPRQPEQPALRVINVETLIKQGKKIVFDSSSINQQGFQRFVDTNFQTLKSSSNNFFVPAFELPLVTERASHGVRFLTEQSILAELRYDQVNDYDSLLKKIAPMGQEKGRLCFVVNQSEKRRTILAAAKAAGVFIQLFSLSDQGQLQTSAGPVRRDERSTGQHGPRQTSSQPHTGSGGAVSRDAFALCTTPERMQVTRFLLRGPVRAGSVIYDSTGSPVQLVKQELVNPNSITYSTDRPGVWAKIYDARSLNSFTQAKAERMLSKKVAFKGLCWPTDILKTDNGVFVGTLVPESKGEPLHLVVFKQATLLTHFPNWTKNDLCDLAITILRTIEYLHSMNILMGCINPSAIRVVSKDEVYFVDTDNYQIEGFPTLVYNVSFTPPELQGKKMYLCGKENENFAVAMLVFMLMMPGKTPYTMDHSKSASDAIVEKRFSFSNGAVYGMPSTWRFMWSHLYVFWGPFYHTFQKNGRYEAPADRLSVSRWLDTVKYYKKKLAESDDPESLKLYPQTFHKKPGETFYRCRKCGVEHPQDYFDRRYFGDFGICNSCIDKRSEVSFTCRACNKTYFYTNRTAMFHASMKKKDSEWKDQRYCRDCKNKTVPCGSCGKETPHYYIRNNRCPDCSDKLRNTYYGRSRCQSCGNWFDVSMADHENSMKRGFDAPARCPNCRGRR